MSLQDLNILEIPDDAIIIVQSGLVEPATNSSSVTSVATDSSSAPHSAGLPALHRVQCKFKSKLLVL